MALLHGYGAWMKRQRPGQRRRVAVVIGHEPLPPLNRLRLEGISRYTRERHAPWRLALFQPACEAEEFADFGPDGFLINHPEPLPMRTRAPRVWMAAPPPRVKLRPLVTVAEEHLGRLAAIHLLERRFRRFVCAGVEEDWSLQRFDGFRSRLAEDGRGCGFVAVPGPKDTDDIQPLASATVRPWVERLAPRTGVFLTQDAVAFAVLRACRQLGREVPGDLAVIGVDDVDMDCELADPPLSSVENPLRTVGYRGAELLDRLFRGDPDVPEKVVVRSPGVRVRQSTDVTAVEDDLVAEAIAVMREDLAGFAGVDAVARRLGVSRSTLHRHFLAAVGQSPHRELQRLRIERSEELLGSTSLTMREVAERCGFTHATHFTRTFREVHATTPGVWRERHRGV